jgi:hypothetical protein
VTQFANDVEAPSPDLILPELNDGTEWKWSSRSVPKPLSVLSSLPNVARAKAWPASLKTDNHNQFQRRGRSCMLRLHCSEPKITRMHNILETDTAVLRSNAPLPVGDCIVMKRYNILLLIQLQPCSRLREVTLSVATGFSAAYRRGNRPDR